MTHDTSELVERLRQGVTAIGLHNDNSTELFDIEDADDAMAEAATTIEQQSAEIARLREALVIAEAPRCFSCGVKVTEPASGKPVWRGDAGPWNGQTPMATEALYSVERCQCGAEATTSYDGDQYCRPCAIYSARRDFEEGDMPGGFE